jgi:hypothetical protein
MQGETWRKDIGHNLYHRSIAWRQQRNDEKLSLSKPPSSVIQNRLIQNRKPYSSAENEVENLHKSSATYPQTLLPEAKSVIFRSPESVRTINEGAVYIKQKDIYGPKIALHMGRDFII